MEYTVEDRLNVIKLAFQLELQQILEQEEEMQKEAGVRDVLRGLWQGLRGKPAATVADAATDVAAGTRFPGMLTDTGELLDDVGRAATPPPGVGAQTAQAVGQKARAAGQAVGRGAQQTGSWLGDAFRPAAGWGSKVPGWGGLGGSALGGLGGLAIGTALGNPLLGLGIGAGAGTFLRPLGSLLRNPSGRSMMRKAEELAASGKAPSVEAAMDDLLKAQGKVRGGPGLEAAKDLAAGAGVVGAGGLALGGYAGKKVLDTGAEALQGITDPERKRSPWADLLLSAGLGGGTYMGLQHFAPDMDPGLQLLLSGGAGVLGPSTFNMLSGLGG